MIAFVDVHYRDNGSALAACGVAREWSDTSFQAEYTALVGQVEPYESGQFYRRELPCILEVLKIVSEPIHILIIDGFVVLGHTHRPGLGWHLAKAVDNVAVVGIAKKPFSNTPREFEILRGESSKPLFVSSYGISLDCAKSAVRSMDGPYRLPTLIKRVDQLSKSLDSTRLNNKVLL